MSSVLSLIKQDLIKSVHDCSKGGLSIALSEISIFGNIGCDIDIGKLPSEKNLNTEELLFSETHSRYLLVISQKNLNKVKHILSKKKNSFGVLGRFGSDQISIKQKSDSLVRISVNVAQRKYFNTLKEILDNG
jgi:phosphoribosylformylglycinamidine (FGAM) synthase-like enzyme